MLKKLLKLSLILLAYISLSGCSDVGCEYKYSYSSGDNFYCKDVSPPLPLIQDDESSCFYGDANHLHSSDCASVGYNQSNGSRFSYNSDNDQAPGGYSGLRDYSAGSGSGGSGGSSYNCNTVWTGDPSDGQVQPQCQTACVYANAGHQQGWDAACSIVAGWGATSSCTVC